MNLETFFEKFDLIADLPRGVERLRGIILQLAVQGKLTIGNEDEWGTELFQMSARGNSVQDRFDLEKSELPFTTSSHWRWLPLKSICSVSGGMTPSKAVSSFWGGDVAWISPKDMKSDEILKSELTITHEAVEKTGLQIYPVGCIFIVARSGILKRTIPVSINRVPASVNQDIKVLMPYLPGMERYLQIMFKGMTPYILANFVKTGTTVQSLKYEEFEAQLIPLPPLAEQKRIVAKVDELMALCDRLEAQQQERDAKKVALTRAALDRFSKEPSPANLGYLFHPSYDITPADLRKTILTMAVQGKLVPQDPGEGSAESILGLIAQEKASLLLRKKAGDQLGFDETANSHLFNIPSSWCWTSLGQIALKIQYGFTASANPDLKSVRLLRITDIQNNKVDWFSVPGCEISEEDTQKYLLGRNDILIARTGGTIGKSFIVLETPVKSVFASYLIRVTPPQSIEARYLKVFLESPLYWDQLRLMSAGTGQPNVNGQALGRLELPLPPLAEQIRIVARVDELMALCDRLEAQQTAASATADKLLDAVVGEMAGVL